MSAPLAHLKVLDLTRLLPGGFCTLILADLGAEVLKIEEPGPGDYVRWMPPMKDGVSAGHLALNRGKRSMTLNLKDERGVEILRELVSEADVLVESFRPGVMDRLGVGYDSLREINPRIVYCAITGYGQDGPYAQRAGHDINYLGYAGVLDIIGSAGGPPTVGGVQIADLGGGALPAAIGILAAVNDAARTGVGRMVDISMMDGAFSWLSFHATSLAMGEPEPERGRMRLSGGMACYSIYECGDGRHLAVGALEPKFWKALCDELGEAGFVERQFDEASQDEMRARLSQILGSKPRDEWVAALSHLDACVGPVKSVAEALQDEHVRARGLVLDVGGRTALSGPLGPPEGPVAAAPGFGEHTVEVLAAIGRAESDIESLRAAGVI